MSLRADQRDYKNAFKKHYHAYSNWQGTGSNLSRRLILAYCVECGLKYEGMKQECLIQTTDAQGEVKTALGQHDLRKLLKCLKKAGMYKFPAIKTRCGDSVHPEEYHQMCRYCIPPDEQYISAVSKFDHTLEEIAQWIGEGI